LKIKCTQSSTLTHRSPNITELQYTRRQSSLQVTDAQRIRRIKCTWTPKHTTLPQISSKCTSVLHADYVVFQALPIYTELSMHLDSSAAKHLHTSTFSTCIKRACENSYSVLQHVNPFHTNKNDDYNIYDVRSVEQSILVRQGW